MPQRDTVDKDALEAEYEWSLAHFLRGQIESLERMGAGDIDYAMRARAYLRRYDDVVSSSREDRVPPTGRHLRLVG